MSDKTLPAWRPLLHGNVIHGYLVVAASAGAARELIEARMREEGCYGLLREWKAAKSYIEPVDEPGVVIPGSVR